jgi:GNAT superfamily N-acetyltransferase
VELRARTDADLDGCVEMARVVHQLDGYPVHLPRDFRAFIASSDAIGAWVAERHGALVGHVALHRRAASEVMALAGHYVKWPSNGLGVVARLLVSPHARREGVGRSLLQKASDECATRGLSPILDVVTSHRAAIKLYEASGWVCAGEVISHFDDGTSLHEFVYVLPPPHSDRP